MTRGVTLDAGALIAVDRDDRRVLALLRSMPTWCCAPVESGKPSATSDPDDLIHLDPS